MIPKKWPDWTISPIAFAVIIVLILLGSIVVPIVSGISPKDEPPIIKKGMIRFGSMKSQACVDCHTNKDALMDVANNSATVDEVFIDPVYLTGYHAQLGCSTCHLGNGEAKTFGEAHTNLLIAPSYYGDSRVESMCITCHGEISKRSINTIEPTIHDEFLDVRHKDPSIDRCSTCHGQVAHGSDPFTENSHITGIQTTCHTCHANFNDQSKLMCQDCHNNPHDMEADCNDCHSVEGWAIKSTVE